jgi:hypothetical protein
MVVLVLAILAPLPPRDRHAILSEVAAAWRLPPPPPRRPTQRVRAIGVGIAPAPGAVVRTAESASAATAADRSRPDEALQNMIEYMARRCISVYLSGRRAKAIQL